MIEQYKINEIKDWLKDGSAVQLPPVQRGFVWKPSQIENLWDSLLRGFPIGSFLISQKGKHQFLMDGQQRATSIAAAFYNPWSESNLKIGSLADIPVLWIDIDPYKKPENAKNKFVIRVVTKSQPWGYQIGDNTKRLAISDRRDAFQKYIPNNDQFIDYTTITPEKRFPFDCRLPIPLAFVLKCYDSDYTVWWKKILDECFNNLSEFLEIKKLTKGISEDCNYQSLLEKCLPETYTIILQAIKGVLEETVIPAVVINNNLLLDSDSNDSQENPTLFVRFNSAGTELKGEELIYSIYKSIMPETKSLVEEAGLSFVPPSRMIVLASRLVLSTLRNSYVPKITASQFQREIKKDDFRNKLINLINNCDLNLKSIVECAIDILKFNDNIPDYIVKDFIKKCPEGFFLLMNWLYKRFKQKIDVQIYMGSENQRQNVCVILYRAYFFGDMPNLVKSSWKFLNIEEEKPDDFWTKHYGNFYNYIIPLVPPTNLQDFLIDRITSHTKDYSISPKNEKIWERWTTIRYQREKEEDDNYLQRINDEWNFFYLN